VKRLVFLWVLMMTATSAMAGEAADASAKARTILVFGDSLSAGYGLAHVESGWVELLRAKLKSEGYGYQVVNASVSGETTAGGLARLPRALSLHHPQIVILELGGNDGLRALPMDQMRSNLAKMVDLSLTIQARVLILGMRIPPNYGGEYTEQFRQSFIEVAHDKKVALVPFLLADIALDPALMQADGVHANESGQPKMLANVWPALQPLLKK